MKAWLAVRNDGVRELFGGAGGLALTRSGFEYMLQKYARAATESCPTLARKTVSPHVLRQTCAMTILVVTGDLRKVSLWLGHSDVKTTEVYLRADVGEKLAVAGAVVPPTLHPGRFRDGAAPRAPALGRQAGEHRGPGAPSARPTIQTSPAVGSAMLPRPRS